MTTDHVNHVTDVFVRTVQCANMDLNLPGLDCAHCICYELCLGKEIIALVLLHILIRSPGQITETCLIQRTTIILLSLSPSTTLY